jgi:glycogen(starch) synthase
MLFAGRLVRDKGLDVALQALALLHHRFPDLGLDIAGRGKEETDLKNLVRSLGLEANIRFLGQLDPSEMAQLYRQCSFVLIPSRWREPFGLVALEAAHHGKPVVASAVGGLSEIVFDQETGFLVEKENPQALAAAIGKLLENQGLRARMGDDARTRAQSEFSFDKFVSSYMLLYHELTKIPVFS